MPRIHRSLKLRFSIREYRTDVTLGGRWVRRSRDPVLRSEARTRREKIGNDYAPRHKTGLPSGGIPHPKSGWECFCIQ